MRVFEAGERSVVIQLDERIAVDVNRRAIAITHAVTAAAIDGVHDVVPSFRAVAVHFDPLTTDYGRLMSAIEAAGSATVDSIETALAPKRVPVCYGGALGPDLEAVARFSGMSEDAVVAAHAAVEYRVFMLGFAPGFAYLGLVDDRIAIPRRSSPRVRVPGGSVGIAGAQTGVYPRDTPGGWQLIGRTPLKVFDTTRPEPCFFAPGDRVRFDPVSNLEYARLESTGEATR